MKQISPFLLFCCCVGFWNNLNGQSGLSSPYLLTTCQVNGHGGAEALWFNPSPSTSGPELYVWDADGGSLSTYSDGTVHLSGILLKESDHSYKWKVDLWGMNKLDWDHWSAFPLRTYYATHPAAQAVAMAEHVNWDFYEMDSTQSTFEGLGSNSGLYVQLEHNPKDRSRGFQIGKGANNKNGDMGMSVELGMQGAYTGSAIFNVDLNCIPVAAYPMDKVCEVWAYSEMNWAMSLPFMAGTAGGEAYFFDENGGEFTSYTNGTAKITGRLISLEDPHSCFDLTISLKNKMDWSQWSALGRTYKGVGRQIADANHPDWAYYLLDGEKSYMTGCPGSAFDGQLMILDHRPLMYEFGFQMGVGANDFTEDYGLSFWFNLHGGVYNGEGSMNLNLNCNSGGQKIAENCELSGVASQSPTEGVYFTGLPLPVGYSGMANDSYVLGASNYGNLTHYEDGTLNFKARVYNYDEPALGWDLDIWLINKKDWTTWSGMGRTLLSGGPLDASGYPDHPKWSFYELDHKRSRLYGLGGYNGEIIELSQSVILTETGFQLGEGAAMYGNISDAGLGGSAQGRGAYEPLVDFRLNILGCVLNTDSEPVYCRPFDVNGATLALTGPSGGSTLYTWEDDAAIFTQYGDRTASLEGKISKVGDPLKSWYATIWLENEEDWTGWTAQGKVYRFTLPNVAIATQQHSNWNYFEIDASKSMLTGRGENSGDTLFLSQNLSSPNTGFQKGIGANTLNADNGLSGEFAFSGSQSGAGEIWIDFLCGNIAQASSSPEVTSISEMEAYDPSGYFFTLQDLPGITTDSLDFVTDDNGATLTEFSDGTAFISAGIVAKTDPSQRFEVQIYLRDRRVWDEWSALGRLYKTGTDPENIALAEIEHVNWEYYEVEETKSVLIGWDAFAGDTLYISHAPSNFLYAFQGGSGGNSKNNDHGISGWFEFVHNGGSQGSGTTTGTGDINASYISVQEFANYNPPVNRICKIKSYDPATTLNPWTITLAGIPVSEGGEFYDFDYENSQFITLENGDAHILGTIISQIDPNYAWQVDIKLNSRMTWGEWSAMGRSYLRGTLPIADDNHPFWDYYLLDESHSWLVGMDANNGRTISITQQPFSQSTGFQVGDGADSRTNSYGFSGWFDFAGSFDGTGGMYAYMEECDAYVPSPILISARAMLEGPYNDVSHWMWSYLNGLNYLPLIQPYNIPPSYYDGVEIVNRIENTDVIDWVLVELRHYSDHERPLVSKAGFIDKNGDIRDIYNNPFISFEGMPEDDYYIVIMHRNHLPVMSDLPDTIHSETLRLYSHDFTTGTGSSYTHTNIPTPPIKLVGGNPVMYQGDVNFDNLINSLDMGISMEEYFLVGHVRSDVSLDGVVNSLDLARSFSNYFNLAHFPK